MDAENVLLLWATQLSWSDFPAWNQIFNCFYLGGSADRLISRFSVLLVNTDSVFILSFLASWWSSWFLIEDEGQDLQSVFGLVSANPPCKKKKEIKNVVGVNFTVYFPGFASLTSEHLRMPRVRLDRLVCTLSLHRVHIPHFLQVFLCPNRPDYLRCTALIFGYVEVDFLGVF